MSKANAVQVLDLRNVPVAQWFSVGSAVATPEALRAIEGRLSQPTPWECRWVARLSRDEGDDVRARLGARTRASGALRLWNLRWHPNATTSEQDALADALLDTAIQAASARGRETQDVAFIEACPAHDVPEPARACAALGRADFARVSTKFVYELDTLPDVATAEPAGVAFTMSTDASEISVALMRRVRTQTQDRIDTLDLESVAQDHEELFEMAPAGPCWLAHDASGPVGYVWVMEEDDGDAWIIDVGVVPAYRGRSVGHALLARAAREMTRRKRRNLYALIDEQNEPSIRMHLRQGFVQRPGAYWTYRRALNAT